MKKLFSPPVVGVLVGLIVTAAFILCYMLVTTYVGGNRPVRTAQEDLPKNVQTYCNDNLPGNYSLPLEAEPEGSCCVLYGFVSENGQEYPYIALVAKQIFMKEYLVREDLMGLARSGDACPDHVWRGSGEITADGYILMKYIAHYEIDENGATVTYERHVKLLDLVSVILLFSLADVAGRGYCRMALKKKAHAARSR